MASKAFGVETPTQGETAVSWQTWSDGAAGNEARIVPLYMQQWQSSCAGPTSDLSYYQTILDAVEAEGGLATSIFHACIGDTNDMSYATFQSIVDEVAARVLAGTLVVVSPDQLPSQIII